jgi:hypothetical protein
LITQNGREAKPRKLGPPATLVLGETFPTHLLCPEAEAAQQQPHVARFELLGARSRLRRELLLEGPHHIDHTAPAVCYERRGRTREDQAA